MFEQRALAVTEDVMFSGGSLVADGARRAIPIRNPTHHRRKRRFITGLTVVVAATPPTLRRRAFRCQSVARDRGIRPYGIVQAPASAARIRLVLAANRLNLAPCGAAASRNKGNRALLREETSCDFSNPFRLFALIVAAPARRCRGSCPDSPPAGEMVGGLFARGTTTFWPGSSVKYLSDTSASNS